MKNKKKQTLNLGQLSGPKGSNYSPDRLMLENDIFRSIQEEPLYEKHKQLGNKQDLRKRLIKEGFDPDKLEGKTTGELKALLDGLGEDEVSEA